MGPFGSRSSGLVFLAVLAVLGVSVPILAADERARVLAANTIMLSAAVAVASIAIGAPLAFLLARTDVWGQKLAALFLLALLFVPLYLQAAAWQAGFGLQGWVTRLAGGRPLLRADAVASGGSLGSSCSSAWACG
jgi:ABC-type Fe3+ transport system permease subunit